MLQLNYDGSFQMNRKNKPYDQWDTCLSSSRQYFVKSEDFQAHLSANDPSSISQSTKVGQ